MITANTEQTAGRGFFFYENYYLFFQALETEEANELMSAIFKYALYGEEPESFSNALLFAIWNTLRIPLSAERKKSSERMLQAKSENKNAYSPSTNEPREKIPDTMEPLDTYEPLAKYKVLCDCPTDTFDPSALQTEFEKSHFLRQTFKTTSKIKRFYDKILQGCYRDLPTRPVKPEPYKPEPDFHSAFTDEEIKSAMVDFSQIDLDGDF